jgi:hypothetical protein
MIRAPWRSPLIVWAARDLMRRPGRSLLLFVALALVVLLMEWVLLLEQSLSTAGRRLIAEAPAVVVRRVNTGGWAPLPEAEALAAARSVAGVLRPRARVWGVARAPQGVVTVIGVGRESGSEGLPENIMPAPGRAWIGPGVHLPEDAAGLFLQAAGHLELEIAGRLPAAAGMAVHDVVAVHPADARRILGLAPGQASDLALDVFHEPEAAALVADLTAAFAWPVQVMTRSDHLERTLADISRRSGMILLAFGPALLALALLAADIGAWGHRERWHHGLLKALGWTGGELLRLQIYRGLMVGAPALAVGTAGAYALLFFPGMTFVPRWLFEWNGPPPGLYLSAQGAAGGFALGLLLAGVPFLAAVFISGWQAAAVDPSDCIEGES